MSALTADIVLTRRGPASPRNEFGFPIAPGEMVYLGSMIGLNSASQVQRIQTAGTIVFLGLADRHYDNTASAVAGPTIVGLKGCWHLAVPGATVANIGATVYASDDGTLTLTNTGSLLVAGVLAGIGNGKSLAQPVIDNGNTFVQLAGS